MGNHLKDLSTVILTGARAVLPVYGTTLLPILYCELGFYPLEIQLD
jgi:hypothetical protein